MSHRYTLTPASTRLTATAGPAPRHGGIGLSVVDGQLSIAIADTDGRVMVGTLHAAALDDFCGALAEHLAEASPEAAQAQLEAASWPTMQ